MCRKRKKKSKREQERARESKRERERCILVYVYVYSLLEYGLDSALPRLMNRNGTSSLRCARVAQENRANVRSFRLLRVTRQVCFCGRFSFGSRVAETRSKVHCIPMHQLNLDHKPKEPTKHIPVDSEVERTKECWYSRHRIGPLPSQSCAPHCAGSE